MTEQQWLAATDPEPMLEWLRGSGTASERQLRLFACACARQVWSLVTDERSRNAVAVAERYADGRATEAERQAASAAVPCVYGDPDDVTNPENIAAFGTEVAACAAFGADDYPPLATYAVTCAIAAARAAANAAACAASSPHRADPAVAESIADRAYRQVLESAAALLRDIIQPFRPAQPDPAWLTPDVVALAVGTYDKHAFARLPDLADALERRGCGNAELLAHLRGPGPHVRGCAALDAVLGRA
jgi:hypothetical protein